MIKIKAGNKTTIALPDDFYFFSLIGLPFLLNNTRNALKLSLRLFIFDYFNFDFLIFKIAIADWIKIDIGFNPIWFNIRIDKIFNFDFINIYIKWFFIFKFGINPDTWINLGIIINWYKSIFLISIKIFKIKFGRNLSVFVFSSPCCSNNCICFFIFH
ncbi:hypothetical protein MHP7448_0446 [Mesomycoplasma hyopneumoniae 7448]|uniref:Uncharacterized protein n=1 Tax=Mesomycoplasma hyopneumoniae (strain 7448) TaxID=262722 RepID=Q4A7S6_MESH7|nr:hypothetical protein MHP7448_0446 [Mesomycoplasma hyopneumoniae 7448]